MTPETLRRKAKAIRKAVKQAVRGDHRSSIYWLKRMPLRVRLKYAGKILMGVKGR